MNYHANNNSKESNGISNLDGERFDGGSALDWNNSRVHLQNMFQPNECWDYVCPPNPVPEDINLVIENTFADPEPSLAVIVTDRMIFLQAAITTRMDAREAELNGLHLNANGQALETYRINSERSSELAKLEQSRDSRNKDFISTRDAWLRRKERHRLIQAKCMKVFVNNLGESPRSIVKDLLAELKFRAAWIKLSRTYVSRLGN